MRGPGTRGLTAALVTGLAVLTIAAGTPVPAVASPAAPRPVGTPSGSTAVAWSTLITGDQVAVGTDGKVMALRRGHGRERVPIKTYRHDDHTYVVPMDAAKLIAEGRVDRRLFDVTLLSSPEYRTLRQRQGGLGVIVTYRGSRSTARANLRASASADHARVTRTFRWLNGEAVTVPADGAADVWSALTDDRPGSLLATAESGLAGVWLDGIQKATLDKSVPQIGAPDAWAAGYDGTGIKVAVLDTGVSETHPDVAGKVVDARDFSGSGNTDDHFGHGTHVASIATGTGVKSAGKYKGVAPGAQILNGKVLGDQGYGTESGVIAGMEWAAASGARIINLSLGGSDAPGLDPEEEAVNRLSAETGALFVISAGNAGQSRPSIGSPGSADEALTVGAVDKNDQIATFSSAGPRIGDNAIKPDLTGPGVAITAAAAPGSLIDTSAGVPHPAEGYLTISGTSMSSPHVAGAAALLAQQHPDWTGRQIKAVLIGSTTGGRYGAFVQGSGRVNVTRAIQQTVVAEPASVSFATAEWPHTDDPYQSRTLTYRNSGAADVTLDLAVETYNPTGAPAPAGFFALDRQQVTVPAGGTAEVTVSTDTTLGGSVNGAYSAHVTATGGGQSVRTSVGVLREVESYNLTIPHLDRTGQAARDFSTVVVGLDAPGSVFLTQDSQTTLRLAKGTYTVDSLMADQPADGPTRSTDWVVQPVVKLTKDTTVTLDARLAKPIDIGLPDRTAEQRSMLVAYNLLIGRVALGAVDVGTLTDFRTAQADPAWTDPRLHTSIVGLYETPTQAYSVGFGRVGSLYTGFSTTLTEHDLATIDVTAGAPAPGRTGVLVSIPRINQSSFNLPTGVEGTLPYRRTLRVNVTQRWSHHLLQVTEDKDVEIFYGDPIHSYEAGGRYQETFHLGVFGPNLDPAQTHFGVFRYGETIYGDVGVFSDSALHAGYVYHPLDNVKTALYRDGEVVDAADSTLDDGASLAVPPEKADYKLTMTVSRNPRYARVSTQVDLAWTFSSEHSDGELRLPVSVVRFTPKLSLRGTAPAGMPLIIPVQVQGAAAGEGNLRSLRVWFSTDGGRNWRRLHVFGDKLVMKNPAPGQGVSLRAEVVDSQGNTTEQVIHNAYLAE